MKKFSLFCFIFYWSFSFSQSKNEKEERIDASEFPQVAVHYFNGISGKVNYLKFYKETDGDKHSFEAKFKLNNLHYSAEFDTLGKLEDIEIVIKEKHIPKPILKTILNYFETNFQKEKFIKIQKKYVNNTKKTDQQFINYVLDSPVGKNTHFEIIAEIKTNGDRYLKEFTFKNTGEFEKSRPVSSSSYEHALY